jgi:phosphate starvation-inducible membrane PsiE
MLISDVQAHHRPDLGVIYITGAILLLAVATLVVRYASSKYPAGPAGARGGR